MYAEGTSIMKFRSSKILEVLRKGPLFLGDLARQICPSYMEYRMLKLTLKRMLDNGQIVRLPSQLSESRTPNQYAGLYMRPESGRNAELEVRLRTAEGRLIKRINPLHPTEMSAMTVSAEEVRKSQHIIAVFDYRMRGRTITFGSFPISNTFVLHDQS
jgi:hypothetical protein